MITDRTESIFTKHMHERDALHTLSQALKGFSIESERMGSSVRVPESGSKTSGKSMRVAGFGGGGARVRATAAAVNISLVIPSVLYAGDRDGGPEAELGCFPRTHGLCGHCHTRRAR